MAFRPLKGNLSPPLNYVFGQNLNSIVLAVIVTLDEYILIDPNISVGSLIFEAASCKLLTIAPLTRCEPTYASA